MEASLVQVGNDGSQRDIALARDSVVIGRNSDCFIRIPLDSVSRRHCEFVVTPDRVLLRDLGSSNGTYVNRRRVTETELAAGDVVSVGPLLFVVRFDGSPATIDVKSVIAGNVGTNGGASMSSRSESDATTQTRIHTSPTAPPKKPDAAPAPKPGSILSELGDEELSRLNDDSSVADFNFDFSDDEKDLPKL